MKKTYIIPTIEVIRVHTQQMLAASAGFGLGTKDGGAAASHEFFSDDELEGFFHDEDLSGFFAE